LEREDTLAAETKSPMQTFAVSDISSLSFLFLLAEYAIYKIFNNKTFESEMKYRLIYMRSSLWFLNSCRFQWFQISMVWFSFLQSFKKFQNYLPYADFSNFMY
jgi:hypothetical protein